MTFAPTETGPKRLLLATDAWMPQVNGVVRTLSKTVALIARQGFEVECITPTLFRTLPCPVYPEIMLSLPGFRLVREKIERFAPDYIHIATEGPVGLMVRRLALQRGLSFSTSFHTMFAEIVKQLLRVPESLTWKYLRWFHTPSQSIMVATQSIQQRLEQRGFLRIKRWSRGIDTDLFHPRPRRLPEQHRPVLMYVGRISKEKGIEDFLRLDTPGTKYIVGDGPLRPELEKRYPEAIFLGYKTGEDLASAYSDADVFVFPSRSETFGNVMLEALASGVPVAAYPAPGPIDVITEKELGCLDENLDKAVRAALELGRREACVSCAGEFTWEKCTAQFISNLVHARPTRP